MDKKNATKNKWAENLPYKTVLITSMQGQTSFNSMCMKNQADVSLAEWFKYSYLLCTYEMITMLHTL